MMQETNAVGARGVAGARGARGVSERRSSMSWRGAKCSHASPRQCGS
jgi:hypothetical protein